MASNPVEDLAANLWRRLAKEVSYWKWVWRTSRFPVAIRILRFGVSEERSERTLAERFMELRLNVDVTGLCTKRDLREFARLSECDDLIEQADWTAEQYAAYIERHGGNYPLEDLRRSFEASL